MENDTQARYLNKSAYVSLLCLIAFALVISICLLKQCLWDSFLSRYLPQLRTFVSQLYRSDSSKSLANAADNDASRSYGSAHCAYSNEIIGD